MDINGYEIFVTQQTLPHIASAWTTVSVNETQLKFSRDSDRSKIFDISGYISKPTWLETVEEAVGLNNSLCSTPSGTYTDGFGLTYKVVVESWEISPVPAANKFSFNMSLKIPDLANEGTYNDVTNVVPIFRG